jgi:hypothetical protein
MKKLLHLSVLSFLCLTFLPVIPAWGGYLLVKDVLGEGGGHVESASYMLDFCTGQVAIGQSMGADHIEWGGFWGGTPWGQVVFAQEEETSKLLPGEYVLFQNYPNPFNPETNISYQLPRAGHVSLMVFNVLGQVVHKLVDEDQTPGKYLVSWNGIDQTGCPVASGVYFYQLVAGEFRQVRKMLLLK